MNERKKLDLIIRKKSRLVPMFPASKESLGSSINASGYSFFEGESSKKSMKKDPESQMRPMESSFQFKVEESLGKRLHKRNASDNSLLNFYRSNERKEESRLDLVQEKSGSKFSKIDTLSSPLNMHRPFIPASFSQNISVEQGDSFEFSAQEQSNQMSLKRKGSESFSICSQSAFYNSFQPVFSKKIDLLNSYHKRTLSKEKQEEYKNLKTLAKKKLSNLLLSHMELPKQEAERLLNAKNPYTATFEYQVSVTQGERFNLVSLMAMNLVGGEKVAEIPLVKAKHVYFSLRIKNENSPLTLRIFCLPLSF